VAPRRELVRQPVNRDVGLSRPGADLAPAAGRRPGPAGRAGAAARGLVATPRRLTAAGPDRLVALVALLFAATAVGVYGWLAAQRVGYPYELDWLEGGTVELVARVLHGQGLYSPPSLGYVGFTYTPLYSLLAAGVAELTGVGFLPLRLVSLAASLLSMGVLCLYLHAVTRSWVAGALAAGLFAASDGLTGYFLDVGRLDSLFLALTLLALWAGRRAGSARAGFGVGLIAFLAFFTKQVGLIAIVPALIVALADRRRAALSALITLILLTGASTLILDAATHGWYRYYVVSELAGQPLVRRELLDFWRFDLFANLRPLSLLALLGLIAAVAPGRRGRGLRGPASPRRAAWGPALYDLAAAAGLLLTAWISRAHSGGYLNVLMPAYAVSAGVGAWAFAALRRRGWAAAAVALGLLLLQGVTLIGIPGQVTVAGVGSPEVIRALPTRRDRIGGEELIAALRRLPGPVLVLSHPWYGTLAGQGSFAQADGITEVLRSGAARGATDLRRALRGSLGRDHIRAVVLDALPAPAWLAPQLAAHFRLLRRPITRVPLRPPQDVMSAPTYLYLRRPG
jgi:hypothetical protein